MAIETYYNETYAGTGDQTMLLVNHNHVVNIAVSGGGGDSYDIEFQLLKGGTRYAKVSAQSGVTLQFLSEPVVAVGLQITTNASGSITIEVRTASRGS